MEIVAIIFSTVALCVSGFSIFYTVKQNELKQMIQALSDRPVSGKYPRDPATGLLTNKKINRM